MTAPDEFDRFYAERRDRLLTLTYCLIGDLASARAAVRDAFVEAWHHWRKVGRLEDPEAWVRVRACAHAQRRHTARPWHREKGLDPEVKATLDALARLPVAQRRVLLLTELTTASLAEIAREVGLSRPDTERNLQVAAAQLAVAREAPSTSIRGALDRVAAHVGHEVVTHRWPRTTIVRRAGSRRRRARAVVGVLATATVLVVTGVAVTDTAGVRPTLAREVGAATGSSGSSSGADGSPAARARDLLADALLGADDVTRAAPGRWSEASTTDGSGGNGLVMPCQAERYADPHPTAALVRTFDPAAPPRADRGHAGRRTAKPARHPTGAGVVQTAEVSARPVAAERAYRTAVSWFAACRNPRAQLLDTRAVRRVGDEATVLVLRTFGRDGSTVLAGVARTGSLTTTIVTRLPADRKATPQPAAALLADAVADLCGLDGAGSCAGTPVLGSSTPVPAAPVPAMLAEIDLPAVAGVREPWVGTEPGRPRVNAAATSCDRTDFSSRRFRHAATRTFLVPGAHLPARFGLTETIGALGERQAAALLGRIREDLTRCPDRQMGTHVREVLHRRSKEGELAVWHVATEISDHASVEFLMGVARTGGSVAQVGFVPAPKAGLPAAAFVALVERAQARLAAMPSRSR